MTKPFRTYIVMGLLCCGVWIALAASAMFIRADARLTQENIRLVQVDMTRTDVEALLGPAVQEDPATPRELLLVLTRPKVWPLRYPMLWVRLQDGRVHDVSVKRYNWREDAAVYDRSRERT